VKRTVPIGLSVIVLAFMLWFAFRSLGTATSEQNETRRQVTRDSSLEARERPVDTPRNVISRSRPEANVQTDGRLGGSDDAAQVRTLAQAVDAHTVASVREALAINAQNACTATAACTAAEAACLGKCFGQEHERCGYDRNDRSSRSWPTGCN